MSNVKKYITTSLTLGLIAAAGALLIAGTNKITEEPIKKYEENKINSGIIEIFGENTKKGSVTEVDLSEYKHITIRYGVLDNDGNEIGCAFRADGSNSYGKISLVIGFDAPFTFKGFSVITNEQSFATTLNKNYITKVQDGTRELDDVSCGATYGAKLVRDLINEAGEVAKIMTKD